MRSWPRSQIGRRIDWTIRSCPRRPSNLAASFCDWRAQASSAWPRRSASYCGPSFPSWAMIRGHGDGEPMHLTPHELDKLALHQAGVLAQKRLARGLRLNYPEAVALIATQVLEFIRDGRSVAELMDLGRRLLGRADVMDQVGEMLTE